MKQQADKNRAPKEFQVGDRVLLKLQPYRQHSVKKRHSEKLGLRFYGPFEITKRIGSVAYQLALPASSRIHPIFHVSLLKPFLGTEPSHIHPLPNLASDNHPIHHPLAFLNERTVLLNGHPQRQVLVQWDGLSPEDASWESLGHDGTLLPSIEDNALSEVQGNVRDSTNLIQVKETGLPPRGEGKRPIHKPAHLQDYV